MAGIEEAFEKFSDRLAREESKRYARDEQGDYVEEVQDPYPIKLGPLELGANANIATGKFSPNKYEDISTMNRNLGLRGKYNVPDSGIALIGSIGDVRSSQNVKTNLPFNPMTGEASPYSEMRKDVYKDSPYSVGAQYTPQGTDEMYSALYNKGGGYNLGYNKGPVNVSYTSNPGLGNNVMLRGQYNFADGGVASMFRKRPGYAEGGEIRRYEDLEYNPSTGNFEKVIREGPYWDTKEYSDPIIKIFDKEKGFIDIDKGVKGADHLLVERTINGTPINEYLNNIPTVDPFSLSYDPNDPKNLQEQADLKAFAETNRRDNLLGKTFPEGYFDPATYEIPTVDPFSGQQVSAQDQAAFTQPQAEIFPQQPSPIEQFKAERQFQSEADAAARSGIPFTKTIQNYLGNLYSGPEIANMQEQTFGTSNLSGDTGIVSDLRHATAASQVRDKIADAVSMGYFNPAGILPQSLGLFGSQVLGAANEIQSIRPNMQSMRDIGEDLRANFYGATQVPYGQSATTTYNQLLNNPSLPSAQMRSQQEASARVMPTRMAYGGRVSMSDGGRAGYADGSSVAGLAIKLNRPVQSGDPLGSYYDDSYGPINSLTGLRSIAIDRTQPVENISPNSPRIGPIELTGVLPSQLQQPQTSQIDISTNPIARSLEMAGFTKEEIMRILGQQGLANGGRVSMSDGGLTTTIAPAKGPDSQGVESLFRRRYN